MVEGIMSWICLLIGVCTFDPLWMIACGTFAIAFNVDSLRIRNGEIKETLSKFKK